jgi:hypothetical protein
MTSWECYENKWFHMKYIGKMAETESLLSTCCKKQKLQSICNPNNPVVILRFAIIWNQHGHECSRIWKWSGNFTLIQCIKKCRDFLGRDILGTTFFTAESSLIQSSCRSFIRVIVPYEISKVNFRVETKNLVSMSEEI